MKAWASLVSGTMLEGPSVAALRLMFAEAKGIMDAQIAALDGLDARAARVTQFNTLVIGFLVTGFSVAYANDGRSVALSLTAAFILGFTFLVTSMVLAVLALLKKRMPVRLSSFGLVRALNHDFDERGFLAAAIEAYHAGVLRNEQILDRSAGLLKASMICLISGVLTLTLGAIFLLTAVAS